jgi:hypothetical protein
MFCDQRRNLFRASFLSDRRSFFLYARMATTASDSRKRAGSPTRDDQAPPPLCQAMIVFLLVEESTHTRWFTVSRSRARDMDMQESFDRIYRREPHVKITDRKPYNDLMRLSWASPQAAETLQSIDFAPTLEELYRRAFALFEAQLAHQETADSACMAPAALQFGAAGDRIEPVDYVVYCDDYC